MIDEDKAQQQIYRAARAKALIEDETLVNAFAEVERGLIERWRNVTGPEPADTAKRERLWLSLFLIEQVKTALRKTIEDGKMASATLNALQGRKAA